MTPVRMFAAAQCLALLLSATTIAATRHGDGAPAPRQRAAARRKRTKAKMREENEGGRVAAGVWGGAHVRLDARADGAALEFDCARGEISAPLKTDAAGRFDLPGTFTRESPGPIRLGVTPSAQGARYAGRVAGDTMTLTLKIEGAAQDAQTFTLTRGSEGRLRKCR